MAVAGALTIAFSAILVRKANVAPATAAVFRCAYAVPPLGILAWIERRRHGPRTRRELKLSLWAGAFFAADLICWHYAIHDVGAGLATVLGNLQVVLVGLVAWLTLGERPETRVIAAVPIALFGIVLISGVIGSGAYGVDPVRGVIFGAATGLTYAGFILVLRQSGRDLMRPVAPLFEATLAAGLRRALRTRDRRRQLRALVAGARLAPVAGHELAGRRLAFDLSFAAATASGPHIRSSYGAACRLRNPGSASLERIAFAPATGRCRLHLQRNPRSHRAPLAGHCLR